MPCSVSSLLRPWRAKSYFTHQLLQALHLLADCGLGTAHRGGGGGEGVQIGDRHEGAKQIEIEVEYRTIGINHVVHLQAANADLPC